MSGWIPIPAPPSGPIAEATACVINGKLYVFGAYDGTSYTSPTQVYDPATNTWSTATSVPAGASGPRFDFNCASVGGKAHILGGTVRTPPWDIPPHQVYDPVTDTWSSAAPCMPLYRPTPIDSPTVVGAVWGGNPSAAFTLPTTLHVGDQLVAFIVAAPGGGCTVPGGWTLLRHDFATTTFGTADVFTLTKTVAAGDAGSSVNFAAGPNAMGVGLTVRAPTSGTATLDAHAAVVAAGDCTVTMPTLGNGAHCALLYEADCWQGGVTHDNNGSTGPTGWVPSPTYGGAAGTQTPLIGGLLRILDQSYQEYTVGTDVDHESAYASATFGVPGSGATSFTDDAVIVVTVVFTNDTPRPRYNNWEEIIEEPCEYGGKLYWCFSADLSASPGRYMMQYDPATDAWTQLTAPPDAWVSLGNTSQIQNGWLVNPGGGGLYLLSRNSDQIVLRYDVATDTWTQRADMLQPRNNFLAAALPGEKILVAFGYDSNQVAPDGSIGFDTATVEIYDVATNTWTADPVCPYRMREFVAGGSVGNSVFAIGGEGYYDAVWDWAIVPTDNNCLAYNYTPGLPFLRQRQRGDVRAQQNRSRQHSIRRGQVNTFS